MKSTFHAYSTLCHRLNYKPLKGYILAFIVQTPAAVSVQCPVIFYQCPYRPFLLLLPLLFFASLTSCPGAHGGWPSPQDLYSCPLSRIDCFLLSESLSYSYFIQALRVCRPLFGTKPGFNPQKKSWSSNLGENGTVVGPPTIGCQHTCYSQIICIVKVPSWGWKLTFKLSKTSISLKTKMHSESTCKCILTGLWKIIC